MFIVTAHRAIVLACVLAAASLLAAPAGAHEARGRVIESASAGAAVPWSAFDTPGPTLHDIDGDGVLDIVDQNVNRRVVVVDGRTGQERASLTTEYPEPWAAQPLNQVTVAAMAPGQAPSLVVANSAGVVTRFQFAGEAAAGRWAFEPVWSLRLDQHEPNPGMDGAAIAADLDGDGTLEILAQTEKAGAYALRADGTFLWHKPLGGGNAEPAAGDLDGDGRVEAVFASDGGHVTVLDGASGKQRWQFWAGADVQPGAIPRAPLLADLDGDAKLEVAFVARDAHDQVDFSANHFVLYVLGADGKLRWKDQPAWGNPLSYTRLVAADADGDGTQELFGMDWNTIGHKPGNWTLLGPAHVFSYSAEGEVRWWATLDNFWSNDDVAVADVDGDAQLEVLAVGVHQGRDGLFAFDAATGRPRGHVDLYPWMVMRGPEVADLEGDGIVEAVVSVQQMAAGSGGGGFAVVSFVPTAHDGPPPAPGAAANATNTTGPDANAANATSPNTTAPDTTAPNATLPNGTANATDPNATLPDANGTGNATGLPPPPVPPPALAEPPAEGAPPLEHDQTAITAAPREAAPERAPGMSGLLAFLGLLVLATAGVLRLRGGPPDDPPPPGPPPQ